MSSEILSMLNKSINRTSQAKSILAIFEQTNFKDPMTNDSVLFDDGVLWCAFEGVNALLSDAMEIQYQVERVLKEKQEVKS